MFPEEDVHVLPELDSVQVWDWTWRYRAELRRTSIILASDYDLVVKLSVVVSDWNVVVDEEIRVLEPIHQDIERAH